MNKKGILYFILPIFFGFLIIYIFQYSYIAHIDRQIKAKQEILTIEKENSIILHKELLHYQSSGYLDSIASIYGLKKPVYGKTYVYLDIDYKDPKKNSSNLFARIDGLIDSIASRIGLNDNKVVRGRDDI